MFKTSQDAKAMGVFYTSAIRFFGARTVLKEAGFWGIGEDLASESEKNTRWWLSHVAALSLLHWASSVQ